MTDILVRKLGGSVLRDANGVLQMIEIIESYDGPQLIVNSAQGGTVKTTDLLFQAYEAHREQLQNPMPLQTSKRNDLLGQVVHDFGTIVQDVREAGTDLTQEFSCLFEELLRACRVSEAFLVSRGEREMGRLLALAGRFGFVDPTEVMVFDEPHRLNFELSLARRHILKEAFRNNQVVVMPGFYGAMLDGTVVLDERNTSDKTALAAACLVGAKRCEIWKDTPMKLASPKIVPNAPVIRHLFPNEAQELVDRGSEVVHPAAVELGSKHGIVIEVRSVKDPYGAFTTISEERVPENSEHVIAGISSRIGMSLLTVRKSDIQSAIGVLSAIVDIIARYGIPIECVVDNKRAVGFAVETKRLGLHLASIAGKIEKLLGPGTEVLHRSGKAIVCVVGRAVAGVPMVACRVLTTMVANEFPTDFIDAGTDGISVVLSVDENRHHEVVRALSAEFA